MSGERSQGKGKKELSFLQVQPACRHLLLPSDWTQEASKRPGADPEFMKGGWPLAKLAKIIYYFLHLSSFHVLIFYFNVFTSIFLLDVRGVASHPIHPPPKSAYGRVCAKAFKVPKTENFRTLKRSEHWIFLQPLQTTKTFALDMKCSYWATCFYYYVRTIRIVCYLPLKPRKLCAVDLKCGVKNTFVLIKRSLIWPCLKLSFFTQTATILNNSCPDKKVWDLETRNFLSFRSLAVQFNFAIVFRPFIQGCLAEETNRTCDQSSTERAKVILSPTAPT